MTINRSEGQIRHICTLIAVPLDSLTEERLSDLSWLLDGRSTASSYFSLMVLPPVLLVFEDSLQEVRQSSFVHITSPIH
jgi:hypothetical protein